MEAPKFLKGPLIFLKNIDAMFTLADDPSSLQSIAKLEWRKNQISQHKNLKDIQNFLSRAAKRAVVYLFLYFNETSAWNSS